MRIQVICHIYLIERMQHHEKSNVYMVTLTKMQDRRNIWQTQVAKAFHFPNPVIVHSSVSPRLVALWIRDYLSPDLIPSPKSNNPNPKTPTRNLLHPSPITTSTKWQTKKWSPHLTCSSSCSEKRYLNKKSRTGTSSMSTKGKARAAGDNFTAHRAAIANTWITVNKCIFRARTYKYRDVQSAGEHESYVIKYIWRTSRYL